jgi:hypothetical protein
MALKLCQQGLRQTHEGADTELALGWPPRRKEPREAMFRGYKPEFL